MQYSFTSNSQHVAATAGKPRQSCPTLCDPIDSGPPGSPVPGILQARTLEWVSISFSSAGKWKVKGNSLSHVLLFATPWTAAHQALLSMGFSRQEYWSGCHCILCNQHWGASNSFKSSQCVCFIFKSLLIILPLISHSLFVEGNSTIGT